MLHLKKVIILLSHASVTFGYCSVTRTGISKMFAAFTSLSLLATMVSKWRMEGRNFSCKSHTKSTHFLGFKAPNDDILNVFLDAKVQVHNLQMIA